MNDLGGASSAVPAVTLATDRDGQRFIHGVAQIVFAAQSGQRASWGRHGRRDEMPPQCWFYRPGAGMLACVATLLAAVPVVVGLRAQRQVGSSDTRRRIADVHDDQTGRDRARGELVSYAVGVTSVLPTVQPTTGIEHAVTVSKGRAGPQPAAVRRLNLAPESDRLLSSQSRPNPPSPIIFFTEKYRTWIIRLCRATTYIQARNHWVNPVFHRFHSLTLPVRFFGYGEGVPNPRTFPQARR
jgi:hypothetical protein